MATACPAEQLLFKVIMVESSSDTHRWSDKPAFIMLIIRSGRHKFIQDYMQRGDRKTDGTLRKISVK